MLLLRAIAAQGRQPAGIPPFNVHRFVLPRMKKKSVSPLLVLGSAFLVCATSPLQAFYEFGRGELILSTTATSTYDSRVNGGMNEDDDLIFSVFPEFRYIRDAAQIKLDGSAGVRVNRYLDYDQYDSEDIHTNLLVRFPPDIGPRVSGLARLAYNESVDINYDVNERISSETFLAQGDATIVTGLKTSVNLSAIFTDMDRDIYGTMEHLNLNAGFNYRDFLGGSTLSLRYRRLEASTMGTLSMNEIDQSSDTYTLSFSRPVFGEVRGSISYGYRILRRDASETFIGETDDNGSVFTAGLEGPFLPRSKFPKLTSAIYFSYQRAETPGINDVGGNRIAGRLSLRWQARETTQLAINAERNQVLSVNNLTTENNRLYLSLNQDIGHFVKAFATVGYETRDYRGLTRNDDVYVASIGASYRATRAWTMSANYRFRDSQSTLSLADYTRHLVSVSANYTF